MASMCYLINFCIFYMYDDFIYYIILYRISALQMDHYDYALYIHMGRTSLKLHNKHNKLHWIE